MNEIDSLLALNMIDGIGPITIKRLLDAFGSAREILRTPADTLCRTTGIGPETARHIVKCAGSVDISDEMARIERLGLAILTLNDPSYPKPLKEIYDPPPVLYVKGVIEPEDAYSIAVVGARRCSHYGNATAERLSRQIVQHGFTVVSGLARGIDSAAHRGALHAHGRTIAVLGSGIDVIYPPENRPLAEKIAASGALVSEFPLGTTPQRGNFPLRNRIISGLSLGVLVVEAARKSGSLITVDLALQQGRSVFAVPGRIDSPASGGTHALLKEGAKLVESVEDICEEFPYLFQTGENRQPGADTSPPPRIKLSDDEQTVFDTLSGEETSIDEITGACRLPASRVASALLTLELKRLVHQMPGKYFRRKNEFFNR
jgi:DNA processing protein